MELDIIILNFHLCKSSKPRKEFSTVSDIFMQVVRAQYESGYLTFSKFKFL